VQFPSTAAAHSGSQSVALNTFDTGINKEVQLTHDFGGSTYGTASIWLYDTGAGQTSGNYLEFYVFNSSGIVAEGSTQDYDPRPGGNGHTYDFGTAAGGFETSIVRTQDWHHFVLKDLPDSLQISIDDTVVYSSNAGTAFTNLTINMHAPSWRPAMVSY